MNQRLWLVLGVLIPLLFGGWAWQAGRRTPAFGPQWQPHKLGLFYEATHPVNPDLLLSANRDVVQSENYIFDLKTGRGRYCLYGGISEDETGLWELDKDAKGAMHLKVTQVKRAFAYNVPGATAKAISVAIGDQSGIAFYERGDRLWLLTNSHLYLWKKHAAPLQKTLKISNDGEGTGVIDQAGKTLIYVDINAITRRSLPDGKVLGSVVPQSGDAQWMAASGYGRYAIYGTPKEASSRALNWTVNDIATGRIKWNFETPDEGTPTVFFANDTRLLLAVPARQRWEVRDAATGQVLRRLPLVPGTLGAIVSPDGGTLYSVANGVLYRQRAR